MLDPGLNSDSTSLGLLQGLQANDQAAWRRLADLYGPLIEHWCRRAQLQEADALDVRQEVFLAVARRIADFQRESARGAFRGWLRTITHNKISDLGRRRHGAPARGGPDGHLDHVAAPQEPDADQATVEAQILYRRALALLQHDFEERTWRAFWGVVIDARDPKVVAADLGVSVNVVYLAKSRVLARLRQEFASLLDL